MRPAPAIPDDQLVRKEPAINAEAFELKLSFDELTLIHKSLLAAKALGVLSQEDAFVDDVIELVDRALDAAV